MTAQYPTRREAIFGLAFLVGSLAYNPLGTLDSIAYAGTKSRKTGKKDNSKKEIRERMKKANYQDFGRDSEEVLLAKMLFGEARDCSELENIAIVYTAINRANDNVAWNGKTSKEAILEPYQYECFNLGNPNREKLKNPQKYEPKAYEDCLRIAKDVLSGKYKDPTNGATTYYQPDSISEPERFKKMQKIGKISTPQGPSKHVFYRER